MKLVVTGASGFLGHALTSRLRDSGVDAAGVSRRGLPGVHQVESYADVPDGDVLIHLAQPNDRGAVNAAGAAAERDAAATLAALLSRNFAHFVYISSAVVYGDRQAQPHRATDPVCIDDSYARMKHDSEQAVLSSGRGTVLRLANVYGPGMSRGNVVSRIFSQIPGVGALAVLDGTPVRDFLWHEDAAAAIATIAARPVPGVFNLGTGRGTSVRELATIALEAAGEGGRSIVETDPSCRASTLIIDISATLEQWPWQPRTTVRAGLAHLLAHRDVHA